MAEYAVAVNAYILECSYQGILHYSILRGYKSAGEEPSDSVSMGRNIEHRLALPRFCTTAVLQLSTGSKIWRASFLAGKRGFSLSRTVRVIFGVLRVILFCGIQYVLICQKISLTKI